MCPNASTVNAHTRMQSFGDGKPCAECESAYIHEMGDKNEIHTKMTLSSNRKEKSPFWL